jgi:hypothetical protein
MPFDEELDRSLRRYALGSIQDVTTLTTKARHFSLKELDAE